MSYGDNKALDCNQSPEDLKQILGEEVESAIKGKSFGVDNIPGGLVQAGEGAATVWLIALYSTNSGNARSICTFSGLSNETLN